MAFTNISQWAGDNLVAIQVGLLLGGRFAGFAGLLAADTGDNSGMRRLRGSIRMPVAGAPPPDRVPRIADAGIIATFTRANTDVRRFEMELAGPDLDFEAMIQGAIKYVLGEWDMIMRDSDTAPTDKFVIIATRYADSQEAATLNEKGYENLICLNSSMVALGDDGMAVEEFGSASYDVVLDKVTTLPWGITANTAFTLTSGGRTVVLASEYPLTMEAFIGDNSITAVPLTYAPVTAAKTKAFDFDGATALTVSSVDVGAKTATLSAAPASGVEVVLIYETADIEAA